MLWESPSPAAGQRDQPCGQSLVSLNYCFQPPEGRLCNTWDLGPSPPAVLGLMTRCLTGYWGMSKPCCWLLLVGRAGAACLRQPWGPTVSCSAWAPWLLPGERGQAPLATQSPVHTPCVGSSEGKAGLSGEAPSAPRHGGGLPVASGVTAHPPQGGG